MRTPGRGGSAGIYRWTNASKGSKRALLALVFRFGVLPLLIVLPACFTYVPLDPEMVRIGEEVRLVVSYDLLRESTTLATRHGPSVEGELVRASDDSVGISIWIGRDYRGTPFETTYQTLTVPQRNVLRIERRQLSKWRTGMTALAAVVGIAVLVDRVGLIEDPNPPDDPGGPPTPPTGSRRD